jgi:hypothetical protein
MCVLISAVIHVKTEYEPNSARPVRKSAEHCGGDSANEVVCPGTSRESYFSLKVERERIKIEKYD